MRTLRIKRAAYPAAFLLGLALTIPPVPMAPVRDSALQQAVDRTMAGHAGALVVVEVSSGAILASNNLQLAAHGLERPGSTVKPFVLMALLDSHKVNAEERLICKRPLLIGRTRMDCTHTADVTELNADDAIAYSCNSYFAQVAPRLTENELVEVFRRAGFDSVSGLTDGEASGRIGRPLNRVELQLEALGDSGIEVTPLELLEAYRKLALHVRAGEHGPVFDGLEHSVTYGMAHAVNVEGMRVAGKTGTASSAHNPRTHGFFVGYAPAEKPEIVVVVFLARGRGMEAAAVAQPVFAEYLRRAPRP